MADKRIADLPTVNSLEDTDKLIVGTVNDTYNVTVSTLREAVQEGAVKGNWGASNAGKVLVVGSDGIVKAQNVVTDIQPLSVTENGVYNAPTNTAFDPVTVNVEPELQSKTITANGEYSPDTGYDGLSDVTVNVQPELQSKTITTNGEYAPDTGYDGLSGVTVNVQPELQSKTITENGTYTPDTGYDGFSDVTVNVSGGGTDAVTFYDYDGSVVTSYTAAEFVELSAMPENPTHTGLTAQGWNWTLADAKAYVQDYGRLNIGQMYITDDGKTRIYIHLSEGRTSPMLGICPNGTVDVDWGDGTAHDTLTGTSVDTLQWTPNHAYAAPGDYVIKLTVTGSVGFRGTSPTNAYSGILRYSSSADGRNKTYQSSVKKIEVGSGATSINSSAFRGCTSLTSITIPNSVTRITSYAFYGCSLTNVTIPNGVTSIYSAFSNCTSLTSITIPNSVTDISMAFYECTGLTSVTIPNRVTSIGSTFYECSGLTSITIPNSVTRINSMAFYECTGLTSITIPNSVTNISNETFYECTGLTSVIIPNGVTNIDYKTFYRCSGLTSITIPNGVTSIGDYAFYYCSGLTNVTIPNSVASIGEYTFHGCTSLTNVTIPNSVASIDSYAFYNCYGLAFIRFKSTTPPTVSNANAFTGIPTDCIIYVPTGSLAAYQSAANYPDPATYTYIEE